MSVRPHEAVWDPCTKVTSLALVSPSPKNEPSVFPKAVYLNVRPWARSAWSGERGRAPFFLPLRWAQSLEVMGWACFSYSKRVIWGLPWAAGKAGVRLQIRGVERSNTFNCFHIGFPCKILPKAGLAHSAQQAPVLVCKPPTAQQAKVRWREGRTTHLRELVPVFSEALFLFPTLPCLAHSLCSLQWKDHSLSFVPLT